HAGDAASNAAMTAIAAATTRAGNAFLLLACQFLPAIDHPRYSDGIIWLHVLGSGKRLWQTSKKAKQIRSMISHDERFANTRHALERGSTY
ncbi:MAG: hypothetical protein E6471_05955, partial [Bradyrhizobium sp.]|nr:hypothetical protein [Bradyrhizobium sp.]